MDFIEIFGGFLGICADNVPGACSPPGRSVPYAHRLRVRKNTVSNGIIRYQVYAVGEFIPLIPVSTSMFHRFWVHEELYFRFFSSYVHWDLGIPVYGYIT